MSGYIPGIRPGERNRIHRHDINEINYSGCFVFNICMFNARIFNSKTCLPFYLGGTSILIVVVVAMDTVTQVQTRLMSSQYESLIKKTKFGK